MTVYERIDDLLFERGMSRRELARQAGIKETTLASVFARRPEVFPTRYLKPIAKVFGLQWEELAGYAPIDTVIPDKNGGAIFRFGYERPDIEEQLQTHGAASDGEIMRARPQTIRKRMKQVYKVTMAYDENGRAIEPIEFAKTCVIEMMEYLNQRGIFELFRYAGELTQNDAYLAHNEFDTEVTPCPEDAPQTAAEPNPASDLTGGGNAGIK